MVQFSCYWWYWFFFPSLFSLLLQCKKSQQVCLLFESKTILYETPNRAFIPAKKKKTQAKIFLSDLLDKTCKIWIQFVIKRNTSVFLQVSLIFRLVWYLACPGALSVLQHFLWNPLNATSPSPPCITDNDVLMKHHTRALKIMDSMGYT